MTAKELLRKISSLSTAAAAFVGTASVPESAARSLDPAQAPVPIEPLLLKPAPVTELSEQLFAAHRSHSSHRSHYSGSTRHSSHYSATTYTAPPPPVYRAATPRPPVVPATRLAAPTPMPAAPRATAPPIARAIPADTARIDLTNGAILYGTVLVKSAAGISFRSLGGKTYKLPRILLSARTIAALNLPPETGTRTAP